MAAPARAGESPGRGRPWHRIVVALLRDDATGAATVRRLAPDPRSFRRAAAWLRDRGHEARAVHCEALLREIHGEASTTLRVTAQCGREVLMLPAAWLGLPHGAEVRVLAVGSGALVLIGQSS